MDDLKAKQAALDKTVADGIKATDGHRKSFDELTAAEVIQMQAAYKAADQNRADIETKKGQEEANLRVSGSLESVKQILEELAAKNKALGSAINADVIPRLSAMKEEYEALRTVAQQHAAAVNQLAAGWDKAAHAAKRYGQAVKDATADSENGPNSTPPSDSSN